MIVSLLLVRGKSKPFLFLMSLCFSLSCGIQDPSPEQSTIELSPVDKVYPLSDAANSRWFYFTSACRPFGMVDLSPDTQIDGAWGSGYRYDI